MEIGSYIARKTGDYMNKNDGTNQPPPADPKHQLEDKALKAAAAYLGRELLPIFGIHQKMIRVAPTEQIYLDIRQYLEDFNYEMEDGSWVHLEFESDSIRIKDLRRFRVYEAHISFSYDVSVTTYVICSSDVKIIRSELQEGINTYRVQIIRMKDKDADVLIADLEEKQRSGTPLKKGEMVSLILTPLMSGTLTQKDRMKQGFQILQKEHSPANHVEIQYMQAVLYAFASKFLTPIELNDIKEVMTMTTLMQELLSEGIERGIEQGIGQGIEQGIEQGIARTKKTLKLFQSGKTATEIAEECGLSEEEVRMILED